MFDRLVLRLVVLMAGVLVALSASPALCAASQRDVFYTYDALGHQLTAKFNSATGADRITNAYNGFGELRLEHDQHRRRHQDRRPASTTPTAIAPRRPSTARRSPTASTGSTA
jgi:hypothetical protein